MWNFLKSILTRLFSEKHDVCLCYSPRYEDCAECGFPDGCFFRSTDNKFVWDDKTWTMVRRDV
jgi:hypothetical protein